MVLMKSAMSSVLALLVALSLAGCSASGETGDAGRVQVAAGFYALEYVAEQVGGDHVEVTSLTTPGRDPHDAELTVAQTAEVAEADVVLHLGGFQPVVDDAVEQVAEGAVVDAATTADLVATGSEHRHGDEVHGEEEAEDAEGGEVDPHFWLDPTRMAAVAGQVTQALQDADPSHADDYAAGLRRLERSMAALDADLSRGLADCERRLVVVSHDAFGYLAERYSLDAHAIAGLSPDAEPSLDHLRELQGLIRAEGITTVFSETLASPEMAQSLGSDLGLTTDVLDPVEGLSDETSDEDYVSLMRGNLAALRKANGCR